MEAYSVRSSLCVCPVCGRKCTDVLQVLSHLGEHTPQERAAVTRRQVADLRDLMRAVRLPR